MTWVEGDSSAGPQLVALEWSATMSGAFPHAASQLSLVRTCSSIESFTRLLQVHFLMQPPDSRSLELLPTQLNTSFRVANVTKPGTWPHTVPLALPRECAAGAFTTNQNTDLTQHSTHEYTVEHSNHTLHTTTSCAATQGLWSLYLLHRGSSHSVTFVWFFVDLLAIPIP